MKILSPNPSASPPPMRRVLCVFRPVSLYPRWERLVLGRPVTDRRDLGTATSFWRRLPTGPSHVLVSRISPRPVSYMLQVAHEFLLGHAPDMEVDLLTWDSLLSGLRPDETTWIRRAWGSAGGDAGFLEPSLFRELKDRRYDSLILLYADAIGLGWGRTERRLARLRIPSTVVINGRRRVFLHDGSSRRALRLRRVIEKLWLMELALLPAIALGGIPLTIWDLLRGLCRRFRSVHT